MSSNMRAKRKKNKSVPDIVRANAAKHIRINYDCENCSQPGAAIARIERSAEVGRGRKNSSGFYKSEITMKGQAKGLAKEKIKEVKKDLSAGIENAIRHNIRIYEHDNSEINPRCTNCGNEQAWAAMINKAIMRKKTMGILGIIASVSAFFVMRGFIVNLSVTIGSLLVLSWFVLPIIIYVLTILIVNIYQYKSMEQVRIHISKSESSGSIKVGEVVSKSYKYDRLKDYSGL